MHQFARSKMVGTINGLNKDEYRLLGRWLRSPFFNVNKSLVRFHKVIKRYHPNYDHPNCSKEKLFQKIFPGEEYQAKPMLVLMSELTKQVEMFLVHQQLNEEPDARENLLKNSYLKRNQIDRYEKRIRSRITKLEQKKSLVKREFLELAHLFEDLYNRPSMSTRYKAKQDALMKMNHYLDRYYALGKHRILNELTERTQAIKGDNGVSIDKSALSNLREKLQEPVLDLYGMKAAIEIPEKETDYFKLKNQFLAHFHLLELKDQKILFFSLVNMAIRIKVRVGKLENLKQIHQLYKLGLKHNWLIHNKQMTSITFCNIVLISNSTEDYAFSEKFVEQYVSYLEIEIQEDAKIWALAETQYRYGHFKETIDLLKSHRFSVHVFNLQTRVLLLKAYFDLYVSDNSYDEFFEYYTLATEKFFRRDKFITKSKMDSMLKLLRYSNSLAVGIFEKKLNLEFLTNIKQEIALEENISSKDWLFTKIKELEKKAAT